MPSSSAAATDAARRWTMSSVGTLVVAVAVLATSIPIAVMRAGHAAGPSTPPEPSPLFVPAAPPPPAPTVPLRRHTLRTMAASGARSLAMNIAAGNDEVVQAIMSGPRSISSSAHCSVRAVVTQLFPSRERRRTAVTEHRAGVAQATADVQPRAVGSATADVPDGVTPPFTEEDGRTIDANAIRVSVLLYRCQ